MSTAASDPPPATANSKAKTKTAVTLSAARLDAFIVQLNRCMDTPAGIDIVLSVVCYGSRLAAAILSTAAGRALLHGPIRQLFALALAVPARASTLILLTTRSSGGSASSLRASPTKAAVAASALALAGRLRALGSLMSEARMMLRLWGLLSMYVWARALVKQLLAKRQAAKAAKAAKAVEKEGGSSDASTAVAAATPATSASTSAIPAGVSTFIEWTQLVSCVGYQVLENGAYLSSRGVMSWSPDAQNSAYLWSSRIFGIYVVAELPRLAVELRHKLLTAAGVVASDRPAHQEATAALQANLVRYAALAPMTAQWSTDKTILSDASMSVLGCVSAAIQMAKLWRQTAD